MYTFKKIVGRNDFSNQFRKIIIRYKSNGYNMNVMRQTACLVVNLITVNNVADLFKVDWGLMICLWSGPSGFNCLTYVAPAFQSWLAVEYSSCFISVMNLDLYVRCFDSLMSRGPLHGPNNFYVYTNHIRT